jgi:hypothetical protein
VRLRRKRYHKRHKRSTKRHKTLGADFKTSVSNIQEFSEQYFCDFMCFFVA